MTLTFVCLLQVFCFILLLFYFLGQTRFPVLSLSILGTECWNLVIVMNEREERTGQIRAYFIQVFAPEWGEVLISE